VNQAADGGLAPRTDLAIEAGLVGAEFRLGQCAGMWKGSVARDRVVWGWLILALLAFGGFIPAVVLAGTAQAIATYVIVALAVTGVLCVSIPPRTRTDRLYQYDEGIAL